MITDEMVAKTAERRRRAIEAQEMEPDTVFTCDDCDARHECQFAFDWYNHDGDCLAEK